MPETDPVRPLARRVAQMQHPGEVIIGSPRPDLPAVQATYDLVERLLADQSRITVQHRAVQAESVTLDIQSQGRLSPVSFWGTPSGFELEGLVWALECATHTATPDLSAPLTNAVQYVDRELKSDLYVAPT